jgi:hypothetical protein
MYALTAIRLQLAKSCSRIRSHTCAFHPRVRVEHNAVLRDTEADARSDATPLEQSV